MRHVYIAIPSHKAGLEAPAAVSLAAAQIELAAQGILATVEIWSGDSIIPQARNLLVAKFLASGATDLFFIDDDVSWETGAFTRMLNHPVDFVAGVYRHKKLDESYPVNWLDKPELWADPQTGLLEVRTVPFGFVRLTRKACEDMATAHPQTFIHPNAPNLICWCLFDLEYRDGVYIGEDFVFCDRWRKIGGQVWVDTELTLGHTGKHTFTGNLGQWLRNR